MLWFPVAAPQLFLQDGTLVPAIGRERLDHADTPVSLRLSIEFGGEAPVAAYFCGRRQPLTALHDNQDAPVAYGSGIATATFPAEPIGVRPLSLFVLAQPETMIAPAPAPVSSSTTNSSNASGAPMLAVETTDDGVLPLLADSAERVAPLVQQWLGPHPLTALTIIDHAGQPFEDGPLLVAPVGTLAASTSAPLLAHSLTHAWIQTGQPWMDEGLAEFFSLLWIEREHGREDAVKQLDAMMQQVASADTLSDPAANATSDTSSSSGSQSAAVGQPLIAASDELFFRRKAAAVWWMLRDIAGEQPLQLALSAWRTQPPSYDSAEAQAQRFEALLEKMSGKDLAWFFNDWVLHDRGLPALSIVDVTPRELPAGHRSRQRLARRRHRPQCGSGRGRGPARRALRRFRDDETDPRARPFKHDRARDHAEPAHRGRVERRQRAGGRPQHTHADGHRPSAIEAIAAAEHCVVWGAVAAPPARCTPVHRSARACTRVRSGELHPPQSSCSSPPAPCCRQPAAAHA